MVPLSIVYCSGQMSDWKLNVATCEVGTIAGAIGTIGAMHIFAPISLATKMVARGHPSVDMKQ